MAEGDGIFQPTFGGSERGALTVVSEKPRGPMAPSEVATRVDAQFMDNVLGERRGPPWPSQPDG
jgi:hypothetical protein